MGSLLNNNLNPIPTQPEFWTFKENGVEFLYDFDPIFGEGQQLGQSRGDSQDPNAMLMYPLPACSDSFSLVKCKWSKTLSWA